MRADAKHPTYDATFIKIGLLYPLSHCNKMKVHVLIMRQYVDTNMNKTIQILES